MHCGEFIIMYFRRIFYPTLEELGFIEIIALNMFTRCVCAEKFPISDTECANKQSVLH